MSLAASSFATSLSGHFYKYRSGHNKPKRLRGRNIVNLNFIPRNLNQNLLAQPLTMEITTYTYLPENSYIYAIAELYTYGFTLL